MKEIDVSSQNDLIDIFGRTNQKQIATLLPETLAKQIQAKLNERTKRFHELLQISLDDLCNNRPLDLERLNIFYQSSVFSSQTIQESVIREIAEHLLSLSMPPQESRYWQCYSLPVIKHIMYSQQKELEQTVTTVFHSTLLDQKDRQPLSLTLDQEQGLFKYAALKGHGFIISWGSLLFLWVNLSEDGQRIRKSCNPIFILTNC